MNRSILIVICDFLLVSLLAFSTVDINKVAQEGPRTVSLTLNRPTNQTDTAREDLTAVMRTALEDERKRREMLLGELANREKQVQTVRQEMQAKDEEAARLQQEQANLLQQQASLVQQQTNLQQQFAAAQANLQNLTQQLQAGATESIISKEKLAAMEAELRKKAEQANTLQQQISQLEKTNLLVLNEKQQLAGQLKVAEVEKQAATEHAARMQEQVKVEREEKAKLAEGVKALASRSGELTQEIRENRPLAPNTIFNDVVTNRVQARFAASRSGLIGTNRRKDTETVLVTDGTNAFALCHVDDTPLTLWSPGTDWEKLTGTLARNTTEVPIHSLSFYLHDPRIVLMPVTRDEARQLGSKIYQISPDPFKFQDAVLVGAREGYYGECRFEIDLTTPEYVKLDHNFLKGLFGKFNPSRGDLVFSKTGQLLGVMANGSYCMMIHNFDSAATFHFGQDLRAQHTGDTLSFLYSQVAEKPLKLQ
jgi:multidrug efflux pump subunit AcrA (membrane-fusion protein)